MASEAYRHGNGRAEKALRNKSVATIASLPHQHQDPMFTQLITTKYCQILKGIKHPLQPSAKKIGQDQL